MADSPAAPETLGAPELTIVLVSWNTKDVLGRCLASLEAHTRGVSFEVVVVDNASANGTVAALDRDWPRVRLLENVENVGFARACNRGMAAARGDMSERRRNEMLLGGFWQPDREMDVDWIAGVFMLLRRDAYVVSGGFDEEFHMYGEDSEWCMRLRRRGMRIVYTPEAVVYHEGSVSSDLRWSSRDRLRRCHLGGVEAYAKVSGRLLGWLYAATMSFGSLVRYLAYTALALVTRGEYYRTVKSLRGWQTKDYAEGFARLLLGRRSP